MLKTANLDRETRVHTMQAHNEKPDLALCRSRALRSEQSPAGFCICTSFTGGVPKQYGSRKYIRWSSLLYERLCLIEVATRQSLGSREYTTSYHRESGPGNVRK